MDNASRNSVRQLSRMRWPLLALTLVSLAAAAQVSWVRLTATHANENQLSRGPSEQTPVPTSPAAPITPRRSRLVIFNPRETQCRVGFTLDDEVLWLAPGESTTQLGDGPWSVAFHRGDAYGDAREELLPGDYGFRVTSEGWRLAPDQRP